MSAQRADAQSPAPEDRSILTTHDAIELGAALVDAWGSWSPTTTPHVPGVAFVSDRDGAPALWMQHLDESGGLGIATKIAFSDDPVVHVAWSADGEWIACSVATNGGVRTQVWVVRPDGTNARRLAGSAFQHAELGPWTRSGHRLVVTFPSASSGEPSTSYLADPATGELTALTDGELIHVLDLSADDELVLQRDGQRGREFCLVVDRPTGQRKRVLPDASAGSTLIGFVRPSPTGIGVLTAYLVTDAGRTRHELVAVPVAKGGWLGAAQTLAAREDAELEGLDGDDAGRLLVLVWNVAGRSEIELLTTRNGRRKPVPGLPGTIVDDAVMSRDGSFVTLSVEGPERPREIWRLDTTTLEWSPLTTSSELPTRQLVSPTLENFAGADGLALTGWLYRPHDVTEAGPAVVWLHGGPEAQERPSFNPYFQAMAATGITVFAPNIRGSSGFGRAFVHADDLDGRFDAFSDVIQAAEHLVHRGHAREDDIAVAGRSYGGYLTLASLAFSPGVFRAGVDICGMSHMLTFYRDTEPWIAAAAVTKYGHPDRDRRLLRRISPLTRVDRIDVPLLVVHGEHDTNVPVGEALQIVEALRERSRPVRYLELEGEGHAYRRADSRKRLLQTMLTFLSENLDQVGGTAR